MVTAAEYVGERVLSGALRIPREEGEVNAVLLREHSEKWRFSSEDLPPAAPREGLLAWKCVPA